MNWTSSPKINIDKTLVIIFAVYSMSLLFTSIFFVSPIIIGDGHEYLGMTASFFHHLTPDLREEDIALREQIENQNGINFGKNLTYLGYYKSLGGAWYSYHFGAYSLLNLPVFAFLHYFNFNELKSFQITNSLLLIFSLFILLLITNLTSSQKMWLFLFSAFNPIVFYIWWPHTEVFSYSFIVVAVAFYLKKDYRLAVLASSLSSLQNPAISVFTIFIIIFGWRAADLHLRELFNLLICALISVIPFLFYYLNYHTISLIVSHGIADISYISLDKIFSLFFDLNFGMIAYIPPLMFLAIFMLMASIAGKKLVIPSLWSVLILMATICSTQANWNCGMMYIHRYSVLMLPIIVLICIYEIPKFSAKKINIYLFISLLITLLIIGPLLYNYDNGNSVKFNFLSKEVLINTPCLYNPPYDVFAERALGMEIDFIDDLPIILSYNGVPRKALTDYDGLSLIERLTGNPIKKADSEQIRKSKIGYINFENRIFKFPSGESELMIYDKIVIENVLSGSSVKLSFPDNGWYSIEDWSGTPTRWMQSDSIISLSSPDNITVKLNMLAAGFYRSRTLEVYSGGVPTTQIAVPTSFINLSVPIHLTKGVNIVRLHVPEGCERPIDKPELSNPDSRCLSLAVQNLTIKDVDYNISRAL